MSQRPCVADPPRVKTEKTLFQGDNTYPECERCGDCCRINVLCMTADDYQAIRDYIDANGITPTDYGKERCCFQSAQRSCVIWEARPQVCRLFNCHIPRHRVLEMDPSIQIDDDLWMVDLHESFIGESDGG